MLASLAEVYQHSKMSCCCCNKKNYGGGGRNVKLYRDQLLNATEAEIISTRNLGIDPSQHKEYPGIEPFTAKHVLQYLVIVLNGCS